MGAGSGPEGEGVGATVQETVRGRGAEQRRPEMQFRKVVSRQWVTWSDGCWREWASEGRDSWPEILGGGAVRRNGRWEKGTGRGAEALGG